MGIWLNGTTEYAIGYIVTTSYSMRYLGKIDDLCDICIGQSIAHNICIKMNYFSQSSVIIARCKNLGEDVSALGQLGFQMRCFFNYCALFAITVYLTRYK